MCLPIVQNFSVNLKGSETHLRIFIYFPNQSIKAHRCLRTRGLAGYDVALTWRRSWIRIPAGPLFCCFRYFVTVQLFIPKYKELNSYSGIKLPALFLLDLRILFLYRCGVFGSYDRNSGFTFKFFAGVSGDFSTAFCDLFVLLKRFRLFFLTYLCC